MNGGGEGGRGLRRARSARWAGPKPGLGRLIQPCFVTIDKPGALDGVAQVEKAEAAEPVIERDHDHVAEPGEVLAVVHGTAARADRKGPPWIQTITGRLPPSSPGVHTLR